MRNTESRSTTYFAGQGCQGIHVVTGKCMYSIDIELGIESKAYIMNPDFIHPDKFKECIEPILEAMSDRKNNSIYPFDPGDHVIFKTMSKEFIDYMATESPDRNVVFHFIGDNETHVFSQSYLCSLIKAGGVDLRRCSDIHNGMVSVWGIDDIESLGMKKEKLYGTND